MNPPKLTPPQVYLIRSDYMTGHVLDEQFQLHRRGENTAAVNTVFSSKEDAEAYIQTMAVAFPEAEFCVYDADGGVVAFYPALRLKLK